MWTSVKARGVSGTIVISLLRSVIRARIARGPIDKHPLAFFHSIDDLGLGAGLEADMDDALLTTFFGGHGDPIRFAVRVVFFCGAASQHFRRHDDGVVGFAQDEKDLCGHAGFELAAFVLDVDQNVV